MSNLGEIYNVLSDIKQNIITDYDGDIEAFFKTHDIDISHVILVNVVLEKVARELTRKFKNREIK